MSDTVDVARPSAAKAGTAGALMSAPVLTVPPDMPVEALAALLAERRVSGVPVVDETGALLGLATEGDLIRRLSGEGERGAGFFTILFGDRDKMADHYARAHGLVASDVMTRAPLATVTEDATAAEVARLLERRKIRRVPVLRNGRLVGLVSRADLLKAVTAQAHAAPADDDARIERVLRARIRHEPWADLYWSSLVVQDGVVTFHGFVRSDEVRRGLRVLAGSIPGVRRVEDRLAMLPLSVVGPAGV